MMTRFSTLLSLTTLVLFAIAVIFSANAVADGKVTGGKVTTHPDWFKESFLEIADDVAEAADAGKHVILFLEMNGCPYCYKMNEENFKHAPYKAFIQENFDVIALNIKGDREVALNEETSATEKEIAETLGVRYTPTVLFLNSDNEPVARINGYRNVEDFKVILDHVQQKAYEDHTLADYINDRKKTDIYAFRDHPQLEVINDLSTVADKPLAVLFEDGGCVACAALHDGHLADPEVREILKAFTLVRLDALSTETITDVAGNKTTPKDYAIELGVTYRPTIVLFDKGREIARIENMLYRFHFAGVLEYVGQRHYEQYPDNPFRYIDAKTAKLLAEGEDVSISDE